MRTFIKRLAAGATAVATAGSMLLAAVPVAHAAQITSAKDTMSRLKVSVTTVTHAFSFTLPTAASGTLTILLDSNFASETANGSMTGSCAGGGTVSGFAANSTTGVFTANLVDCNGAVTINASTTGPVGFTATNPATEGSYTIRIYAGGTDHTTQAAAAAAATHSTSVAVGITDDDQVTVTAAVDPSITFEVGATHEFCNTANTIAGGTVGLGIVPASGTYRTSKNTTTNLSGQLATVNHICSRVSTNATNGYAVTVKSTNGALQSTSVSADKIPAAGNGSGPSFSVTMAAGTPSYGLCVGSAANEVGVATTTPAGASATATSPFNGTCTNSQTANDPVGALTSATNQVYSASGGVSLGWATLYVKAAAGALTDAHTDYTDTLTFVATATF